MTNLTEQLKKGELTSGWYYVKKTNDVCEPAYCGEWIDRLGNHTNRFDFDEDIVEVLAPVPSYYEWILTKNKADCVKGLEEKNIELLHKIEELKEELSNDAFVYGMAQSEIINLKELLKQSRIYVKIDTEDYDDRTVSKADKDEAKKLLIKIDEVLK